MSSARHVISAPGPRWFRRLLGALAVLYLSSVFLGSAGSSLPRDTLPRPFVYFSQVACLFPHAASYTIEYRASAYACREGRFKELDYRPHFPLHADDKENRYHRLGQFYRRSATVMQALDDYLVERHNDRADRGESSGDGIEGRIGGILVMSLRIPVPEPGTRIERYERTPLSQIPTEWRKYWYRTPRDRWRERCDAEAP